MIQESGHWQFDLRLDEFADIKFQGQTVLRSVRAVIRDRNWNTADLQIDSLTQAENEFELAVHSVGFDAEFTGIVGAKFEGAVATFTMELTAQQAYETNRTGLIVLHSPDVAGATLEVTHSNGETESAIFPISISPNQPVLDIAALGWQQSHLQIDVAFAGDVFEMEDQRNWSDASFKTYSHPLSKPFPYLVAAGEKILQILKIQVQQISAPIETAKQNRIALTKSGKFPQIQVGASTASDALPESWETCGNPKGFSLVNEITLVELDLQSTNWKAALDRAADSSKKLDVRFIAQMESDLLAAVTQLKQLPVIRVGVFDSASHVSTPALNKALGLALAETQLTVPVVTGARSHFTELNREQETILPGATELTFSITPLFHSLTTEQLLESVAMQRIIANQVVQMAEGKPVHIGPITLRPRFNNVATLKQPAPTKADLSEGYGAEFTGSNDERQATRELAAWVIASAAATSVSGVDSITWFEQWGPRGLASETGQEYPAAMAVRQLASLAGHDLYTGESPDGFVWAMGAQDSAGNLTGLASNLHRHPMVVEVTIEGQTHHIELDALEWKKF
ncbi:MAG: hypothetical protein RLY34_51 [Actinomycetota bacterium]|jgi:hypothetical protein